ncbi:MAG: hypothetical protein RL367_278 [Pseudomonadota bacterium]
MADSAISFTATLWRWRADAAWHFLTIDPQTSAEIRYETLGQARHFGSIKVTATIGETAFQTSLFPHKESSGYLLPVKASVRKAEGVSEGDTVHVMLMV